MYPYKYLLTILIFSGSCLASQAQGRNLAESLNLQTEFRLHYGFQVHHHEEIGVFNAHFPAYELSLQIQTFGRKRWEFVYNYPLIGISFWYSALGGYEEIGKSYALYPFVNFPLLRSKKVLLAFRAGLGFGYLTRTFHRTENYKNIAIGSHINAAASLYVNFQYHLGPRVSVSAASGITHFSNGASKMPNIGLNYITANLGITYFILKPNPFQSRLLLPELYKYEFDGKKYLELWTDVVAGRKDMSEVIGGNYFILNLSSTLMKQFSYKSRAGLGMDVSYDASDYEILKIGGVQASYLQTVKLGLNLAYDLVMDRFAAGFNFGFNLTGKEQSDGAIYQKLSLKYLVTDQIYTKLNLNLHWGKAEYVGFGLGYRLKFIYY